MSKDKSILEFQKIP
ncbi:hypothetical protein FG05_35249 [Fusarium graminearum]|nr:hypothetical protein FG05_35249 [Fusarium graminearum]